VMDALPRNKSNLGVCVHNLPVPGRATRLLPLTMKNVPDLTYENRNGSSVNLACQSVLVPRSLPQEVQVFANVQRHRANTMNMHLPMNPIHERNQSAADTFASLRADLQLLPTMEAIERKW